MTKVTFAKAQDQFSAVLRREVDNYFRSRGIAKTGNGRLYTKTAILFLSVAALYYVLVFQTPVWYISIPLCMVLGVGLAAIGFNVMHDGAHGSYSSKAWVNNIMAHTLDILGGSSNFWKIKHNVAHHSYTNIEGHDEDIDIRPFIRLNTQQKKSWYHKYQAYYWPLLYSLTYFWWVCVRDFKKYFEGRVASTEIPKMTFTDHMEFWVGKLVYVLVWWVVPLQFVTWPQFLIGYGTAIGMTGFTLGVVFQMAHAVQGLDFPEPDPQTLKIENAWFVHQLNTTANFAPRSKFWGWLTGGLNFQVEHHLFPLVSHIHYPAIAQVVKKVCSEYNIRYNEYLTFPAAFRSHVNHLDQIGHAD